MTAGPPLEAVMRRLAETPGDFLGEPRIGGSGRVDTAALVWDLLHALGHEPAVADVQAFAGTGPAERNRLILVGIAVWLLYDEWVGFAGIGRNTMCELLGARLTALAATGPADGFVSDAERREELARTVFAGLGLVPAGETEAQAADRLSAVSAAERNRLRLASQQAEERAREIREALIRKAAEESADKYTRE